MGQDWWGRILEFVFLPCSREEEDVEKVHRAENEQDESDFAREGFEDILSIEHCLAYLEIECNEAYVDEVKAHYKEVIDAVGHVLIAAEALHEEDATVLVKGLRDPDGEGDGDE